jgi:Transmembrane family 220, helix
MIIRLIHFLLAIIFAFFAIVQYNDPDPFIWIVAYSIVAAISLMGGFNRYFSPLIYSALLCFLCGALYLSPSVLEWYRSSEELMQSMRPDKMFIEETRECLGLWIGVCALFFDVWSSRRSI